MKEQSINAYWGHAIQLTQRERALRDMFESWLPDTIVDAHAHSNLSQHVGELPDCIWMRPLSTFPHFSITDSRTIGRIFHPSKNIVHVRFSMPYKGIDWRGANDYLLQHYSRHDLVAACGDPGDAAYTARILTDDRVCALKMYHFATVPPADHIYDFFPPSVLAVAERLRKPIILHPPTPVPECIDQCRQLGNDFPSLPIIIAHLGIYTEPVERYWESFSELSINPNVYMDTSMCPSARLTEIALETLGPGRILYGSDEPLSLIRAVQHDDPERGPLMIPDYPYHWIASEVWADHSHRATGAVHSHWDTLSAIYRVIKRHPRTEVELKQQIFCDNAHHVFRM